MSNRNAIRNLGDGAFLVGLFTLPWIGFGVIRTATGHDIGTGLQPAVAAFAVSAAALICDQGGRSRFIRPWRGIWSWALLALLVSALGIRVAGSGVDSALVWGRFARQILQWLVMAVITLLTAERLRRPSLHGPALIALSAGMVFQLLYGMIQVVDFQHPLGWFHSLETVFTSNPAILSGSEELYLGHGFTGIPRVRGTACEPLYLGNYLLLVLPFLCIAALQRRRWLVLVVAALGLLAATWSRGAWLAGGVAIVAALLLAGRMGVRFSRRSLGVSAGVLIGGGIILALLAGPEALGLLVARLRQSLIWEDWSNLTRLYSMQAAWRAFLASPVVGIGWGQFGYHYYALVDAKGLQAQFDWPVVNNVPLKILCETGILGFTVFLVGVGTLARRVWSALSPAASDCVCETGRWLIVAAAVAVVGVWGQLLTFSQYQLPHIWVSLGALLAFLPRTDTGGDPV